MSPLETSPGTNLLPELFHTNACPSVGALVVISTLLMSSILLFVSNIFIQLPPCAKYPFQVA